MRTREKLTDAQRQRIAAAMHEAGHAVIGALYGATIERAALAGDGAEGQCDFAAASFGIGPRTYRSHIAAAGAVAAAMFHHGRRPTLHQIEAQLEGSDREELRLASLSSQQPFSSPLAEVLPLVRRCRRAIGELATELYFGREIGHDDVCKALGLTDGGGPGSFQLAMIRSGSAPGSYTVTRAAV